MTTTKDALENAARLLRSREQSLQRTYGHLNGEGVELASGWANLARAIAYAESKGIKNDDQ